MAEVLRVLHVDAEPGYRGGQRQVRLLLGEQLRDAGLSIRALVASERLLHELRALGVNAAPWPGAIRGRSALLAPGVDLLHVHDARSHGAARAAGWPRSLRPLVVHRRIDDPPHARAMTRWKYRGGQFICVSRAVLEVLARWGVPRERLRHVPSAVVAPDPPQRPPPGPALHLVALGALVPHKGHTDLLDALVLCSAPHRLSLGGEGPLRRPLDARIDALGLRGRVELLGDVGEGSELLAQGDLFVQPSRTEGLGTAVLDAQAAALPVVSTDAGGLPEINDADSGRRVPTAHPQALAAAIDGLAELGQTDPDAFARLGRAGRERVLRCHLPRHLSAGVRAVYDELR